MNLIAALVLDALFGEPERIWRRLPHPAVLLGRLVAMLDARLNRGDARRGRGALALALLVAVAAGVGWLIASAPLQPLPQIIAAAILLAQKSLADHVVAVASALERSLEDGRTEVAKIVGRDVAELDEAGVARAAIESAAENFSDGVVAPALWFAFFGLPGMLVYKAVNTADSMIGYRTEQYEKFGWAAARLDDAMNLIPARFSALLLCQRGLSFAPLGIAWRDARLHRSPNAGWPEAAMAATLDIALSGPRMYHGAPSDDPFVHPEGRRDIGPAEVRAAVAALWRGWFALAVFVVLAAAAAATI